MGLLSDHEMVMLNDHPPRWLERIFRISLRMCAQRVYVELWHYLRDERRYQNLIVLSSFFVVSLNAVLITTERGVCAVFYSWHVVLTLQDTFRLVAKKPHSHVSIDRKKTISTSDAPTTSRYTLHLGIIWMVCHVSTL